METGSGKETNENNQSEKDAIAALISGCSGTSQVEARRRLDWLIAAGTAEQRQAIEQMMAAITKVTPKDADPAVQRFAWRWVGKYWAFARAVKAVGRNLVKRRAPGECMIKIASVLFSKKKVERVFSPLVADYLLELEEARSEGKFKVVCVKLAWWWRFARACGFDIALALAGKVIKGYLGF